MKVSLNWASQVSNVDLRQIGDDKLLDKIGAQLGAIDEVDYWGPRYDGITVVKVVSCEKHYNADKLSVCVVDDGGKVADVTRDSNDHIQVVCGAPNVRADMLAAWIPPGVTVPSTLGKEPLVIEARDIRGQTSNGMLASLHELRISDDHDGILEIKPEDVGPELAQPGTEFKKLFKLDDVVADIENKMFTHRPDCFGVLGVARELAGIQQLAFKSPDWYLEPLSSSGSTNVILNDSEGSASSVDKVDSSALPQNDKSLPLDVKVEDQNLVPRFMAVAMKDIKLGPSPVWLQAALARVGIRSINNIVDITNFVMHLTGQPLHAYDYDKLKAHSNNSPTLIARQAQKGEKLTILGGKALEFEAPTIMIASDKEAVGVGGVMGGADTEVDNNTKNIVLECATFDMYNIRRTAMKHGLFTDAVTRFTKGQSPLQNDRILAYAMKLVNDMAGGQQASDVKDIHSDLPQPKSVTVNKDFINARLGLQQSAEDMANLLRNVEFGVEVNGDELNVTAPFWRTDIETPEDIVEEVGRLFGYDHLPLDLPKRSITPSPVDTLLATKSKLRTILSSAGANEVLTYSFVHGDLFDKVGQDKSQAFQLGNALSPELQYYRLSLMPSLLEKVHPNVKQGFNEFSLFEINPVHAKDFVSDDKLPIEDQRLALVFVADDKTAAQKHQGAPYYQAKQYVTDLLDKLGIEDVVYEPASSHEPQQNISKAAIAPFEKQRTALIKTKTGDFIGELGEFRSLVRKNLKLPKFIAGFEVDVTKLMELQTKSANYTQIPRFPKVEQDMTLKVPVTLSYGELFAFVDQELAKTTEGKLDTNLEPIDIFQKEGDKEHRQITLRLRIASYEKTLTAEEVNALLDQTAAAAKDKFGAERI